MSGGAHNGEFSLVHHSILDDPKFDDVWEDNDLLAEWLRLLVAADKAFPSPAPLPISTQIAAFDRLVEIGLIDKLPHDHYLVHGMVAERARRKQRRADAAKRGWEQRNATQEDA